MLKRISRTLAAILVFGVISASPHGARAADAAKTPTIGGYVYSWLEWAISIPKGLFLEADSEIVTARAELISDIENLKAVVARTGFELESISVGMDVIPSVSLALSFNHEISDQERAQLDADLQSGQYNILERALIDALVEASSVRIGSDSDNLVLSGADVDVDIIPGITLTFEEGKSDTVKQ